MSFSAIDLSSFRTASATARPRSGALSASARPVLSSSARAASSCRLRSARLRSAAMTKSSGAASITSPTPMP